MFYMIKGLSTVIGVVAFTLVMYLAIQSVLVPLHSQLDTLDQVSEMTAKYQR
jgi:type IV secretory pathway TrbF-like protein